MNALFVWFCGIAVLLALALGVYLALPGGVPWRTVNWFVLGIVFWPLALAAAVVCTVLLAVELVREARAARLAFRTTRKSGIPG